MLILRRWDKIFPYGNIFWRHAVQYTAQELGRFIRITRKSLGVTQRNLALAAGTGLRFLIELEKGKETCEIGKTLKVLNTLGVRITLTPPPTKGE